MGVIADVAHSVGKMACRLLPADCLLPTEPEAPVPPRPIFDYSSARTNREEGAPSCACRGAVFRCGERRNEDAAMGREVHTNIPLPGRMRGAARLARAAVLLLVCVSALAGCRSSCLSSMIPAPFSRSDDGAIAQGELERAWDEWAIRHLATGDVVFRMGVSRVMLGLFDVSKFSSELADSDYSHAGLVVFEDGRPWVYDACRGHDVRRMPFSEFLMEYELAFGVKRLRPDYRESIPGAVAYCRHVHEQRVPFDDDFRLENGRLYCMELIEGAYRSAGVALSKPVRIDEFPNYHEHPTVIRLLTMYSSLTPDQEVLVPGNDTIGLWASEKLELVYKAADPLSWPRMY